MLVASIFAVIFYITSQRTGNKLLQLYSFILTGFAVVGVSILLINVK